MIDHSQNHSDLNSCGWCLIVDGLWCWTTSAVLAFLIIINHQLTDHLPLSNMGSWYCIGIAGVHPTEIKPLTPTASWMKIEFSDDLPYFPAISRSVCWTVTTRGVDPAVRVKCFTSCDVNGPLPTTTDLRRLRRRDWQQRVRSGTVRSDWDMASWVKIDQPTNGG